MLGEAIRKARKHKGFSQKKLAKLTGLANSTICDMEKGRIKPSVDSLMKIANALEEPVNIFLPSNYDDNVNIQKESKTTA